MDVIVSASESNMRTLKFLPMKCCTHVILVAVELLESALVSMVNKLRDADSKSSSKPTAEVKGHHRVYNSKHNQNRTGDSTKV